MAIVASSLILAAAGYSLLYLVLGGGLGGAILIFIVAKMIGKCGQNRLTQCRGRCRQLFAFFQAVLGPLDRSSYYLSGQHFLFWL